MRATIIAAFMMAAACGRDTADGAARRKYAADVRWVRSARDKVGVRLVLPFDLKFAMRAAAESRARFIAACRTCGSAERCAERAATIEREPEAAGRETACSG